MKNKLILLAVILACFIPSAVAYASYRRTQAAPVDEKTAVYISIDDTNGKNITLVKEQDGDDADQMIQFFLNIRKNAQQIAALPDSMTGEKCYKVTISTKVRADSTEYYFSPDPSTCYLRASDGSAYHIAEQDAENFIRTQFAESIYDASAMPRLLLSNSYDVAPDAAVWQYKNFSGDYVDADVSDLVFSAVETYDLEGGLDLAFDLQPDYCSVRVTSENGELLYDKPLASLAELSLNTSELVTVDVMARWYEDPARSFCGELTYSFSSHVTAPAEFFLGMNSVESGKFIAVTGLNVAKPENIEVTSTMPDFVKPVFYAADSSKCVGLIPVGVNVPTDVYTFTFTYAGTSVSAALEVISYGYTASSYIVEPTVVDSCRTESALAEFEALCKELMAAGSDERYFSGSFLEGTTGDSTLVRGFGREVYINEDLAPAYVNNGVDYRTADGAAIVAANAGKVVYSGNLVYCGNIVVIEHGWGLKTWYWGLGSCTVREGDMVSRGDMIGTAGKTGFTGDVGAHIAMSVGGTFVSPYDTWEDSEVAAKVRLAKIDE